MGMLSRSHLSNVSATTSWNQDGAHEASNAIVANTKIVPLKPSCRIIAIKRMNQGSKSKLWTWPINGRGIRDTARVLAIIKNTVIRTLKKREQHCPGEPTVWYLEHRNPNGCEIGTGLRIRRTGWTGVKRWLWHAVDHATNMVIAYIFGKRKDSVFQELKALLAPFNISRYYTDDWGAYERHLDPETHEIGKTNTQKIERKNLDFRTWIKRLTRRTICFSKLETCMILWLMSAHQ